MNMGNSMANSGKDKHPTSNPTASNRTKQQPTKQQKNATATQTDVDVGLKSLDELKQTVRNTKADFLTVTQHLQTTREAFDGTEKKIELLGQTIDRLDSKSSYIHQLLVDAKSNVTNLAREKQKYAKKVSELSQTKQEALATEAA
jgi:chromosome segregation ATPase